MLISCPSCATSYEIDPGSVGPSGRMVRCARCRATWFATAVAQDPVDAFVDSVIAEAGEAAPPLRDVTPPQAAAGDFDRAPDPHPAADHALRGAEAPMGVAEPVTIEDSPSLVPPLEHMPMPEPAVAAEADTADQESFTARRRRLQSKRQKSRRASRWTAIVLVLFAFNVALIGARNEVVRYLPQTASLFAALGLPVNLRQLEFEDVRISRETQGDATILLVQGKIVSKAKKPVEVPRLRFAARNASGQELYTWTAQPDKKVLPPGETMDFHSSLAKPPADASDVMVRFFTSQDAMAGGK